MSEIPCIGDMIRISWSNSVHGGGVAEVVGVYDDNGETRVEVKVVVDMPITDVTVVPPPPA